MPLDVGGPVELLKWRSASTLEAAPMWVSPTQAYMWAESSNCQCDPKNISRHRRKDNLSSLCTVHKSAMNSSLLLYGVVSTSPLPSLGGGKIL